MPASAHTVSGATSRTSGAGIQSVQGVSRAPSTGRAPVRAPYGYHAGRGASGRPSAPSHQTHAGWARGSATSAAPPAALPLHGPLPPQPTPGPASTAATLTSGPTSYTPIMASMRSSVGATAPRRGAARQRQQFRPFSHASTNAPTHAPYQGHWGPQKHHHAYGYGNASAAYGNRGLYGTSGGSARHHGAAFSWYEARANWAAAARMRLQATRSGGSASGPRLSGTLQPGALVEFEKNDKPVLAVVSGPDGKKNWFVVDQAGRRQSIVPKQAQWVLPGAGYSEADVAAFLAAAEAADMGMLEIAWEIALEGGEALPLEELSSLLFDDTAPRSLFVTHRMMQRDTLFFKQVSKSPPSYAARRAEDVALLQKQQAEAEAARQAAEAWRAAVAAARAAKTRAQQPTAAEWQTGPFAHRVAALKAVALSTPRTDEATLQLALASLQLAGAGSRADPEAAASLLTELGVFRRHEPLALLQRGVSEESPEDEVRVAQALLASPPPDPDAELRTDLTHLDVFTIDDATTTEVDDGLSLEPLPGGTGTRIWVHVADPTRWLAPGSALDLAGRERGRTLYLPWGSVPMFPRQLAEGPFSLREGQVCDAMSVGVVLGRDGSVTKPTVTPSRVRVTHKLTYEAADALLASAVAAAAEGAEGAAGEAADSAAVDVLVRLREAADLRRRYRESRGCIEIPLPEAKIHVPREHLDRVRPAVTITRVSQWDSPSRNLVAEMMILAGEAVGTIGTEAQLPLPYRGQEAPELPPASELAALPEGPCRGFALKRCMTRSTVTPDPQRHASLALDAYVQFTSPIRRYADMVAHYNVKAWLRGEPLPFSGGQIGRIMDTAAERGRELGAAERDSEQYWVAEYLRLNWGAEYNATVLGWQREDLGLVAFLLEDLGLETVVKVQGAASVSPGDTAVLVASEANPAAGFYRFYVAGWRYRKGAAEEEDEDEEGEMLVVGEDGEVVEEEEKLVAS